MTAPASRPGASSGWSGSGDDDQPDAPDPETSWPGNPVRSVDVDHTLSDLPPLLAAAWARWLHRHGINPGDVLVGYPLTCDDVECTVTYTTLVRDENGRALTERIRTPDGGAELVPVLALAVVQLEAPALPLPSWP